MAVAPRFAGDCGARGEPASVATAEGTFDGPASVSLRTGCGSLNVDDRIGQRLEARSRQHRRADPYGRLIRGVAVDRMRPASRMANFLDGGRDAWDLTLPTSDDR